MHTIIICFKQRHRISLTDLRTSRLQVDWSRAINAARRSTHPCVRSDHVDPRHIHDAAWSISADREQRYGPPGGCSATRPELISSKTGWRYRNHFERPRTHTSVQPGRVLNVREADRSASGPAVRVQAPKFHDGHTRPPVEPTPPRCIDEEISAVVLPRRAQQ